MFSHIFSPEVRQEIHISLFMLQVLDGEDDSRTQRTEFCWLHSPGMRR